MDVAEYRRPSCRGEGGFCCWGSLRWAAGGLGPGGALETRATKHVAPWCHGLLAHAQDQSDLRKALAIEDREDGEKICDLT